MLEPKDVPLLQPDLQPSCPTVQKGKIGFVGWISLLGLVICWVAQSEVAQELEDHQGYDKPCLITWINHSWTALLIPLQYAFFRLQKQNVDDKADVVHRASFSGWISNLQVQGLTLTVALKVSGLLSVFYMTGDLLWYIGLSHTSVSAGTAIFNSSCVFVAILSVVFLGMRPRLLSGVALAVTLCGVLLVSFGGGGQGGHANSTTDQMVGSFLILGASICYAIFEVGFQYLLEGYDVAQSVAMSNTVNGCLGLFNLLVMWVCVLIVNWLPTSMSWVQEPFQLPSRVQLVYLIINGLLAFGFNVFLLLSIRFASPFLTSTACVVTIPLSALTDYILWGTHMSDLSLVGCALILVGFGLITWVERQEKATQ